MRAARNSINIGRGVRAVTVLGFCIPFAALLFVVFAPVDQSYAQSPSKTDPEIARLAQQAQSDLHDQKPEQAAAEYQKILALDPNNLGAHSNLGLADYLQGKFVPAAKEFNIALHLRVDLWNIAALCGLSEAKTGENANAVVHLEQAFPHVAEPSLRLAVGKQLLSILLQAGELNRAENIANQLEQLDPSNMDVLYAAHQVYSLQADRAFMAMAQRDPDAPRMYQLRGDRMAQIGNMEGAIVAYRLAIARDPHLSGVHFALAEALSVSHNPNERAGAETEYRSALSDNPLDEKAECRLGDIEMQRSNVQSASEHYQRALQLEQNDPDANEGYGMVLLTSDSSQDARPYFARAIQFDPANAAAHYHLSQASRRAGDLEAAKNEMDEFLRLKMQKEALKRSFTDLPLRAVRQASQGHDEQTHEDKSSDADVTGQNESNQ